eukprot:4065652-Ditylum_brightwellii.AAC.1
MTRYCGTGKTKPKKKQKVSNVEKYCEESANDNRNGINRQCSEIEYEDYDDFDCDSAFNNHSFLKNPKVVSDSYYELSKTAQRAVQCACNQ